MLINCGHWMPAEQSEAFQKIIAIFLWQNYLLWKHEQPLNSDDTKSF